MVHRVIALVASSVVVACTSSSSSGPPGAADASVSTGVDAGLPGTDAGGVSDGGVDGGDAGSCGDTTTDPNNCGACGYACVNGRTCSASRCTPAWQAISTTNAPSARSEHAAVSVYGKYVALGGTLDASGVGAAVATTGRYDPATDTWSSFPSLAQARCMHGAVSTITKAAAADGWVHVFGGLTDCSNGTTTGPGLESSADGGAFQVVSVADEPQGRYNIAVAQGLGGIYGGDLFVYGGSTNTQPAVATGAYYAPDLVGGAKWTTADCALSQCERGGYFAMFRDGDFMRIWGGGTYGNAPAGLQFDLKNKSWSAWTLPPNTPALPRRYADDGRRIFFLNATSVACPHTVEVSIYDRKTSSWLAKDTATAPSGLLSQAAAAWVGSELIAWSGNCGSGASTVGARYQPPAPPP